MKARSLIMVVLVLAMAGTAWAGGFRIPEQGAAAMGMANAWVAQADDPTAIFMNPAGIAQLGSPSISAGFFVVQPTIEHSDLAGNSTDVENNIYTPMDIYITDNMQTTDWTFGIGLSYPFGLGSEWAADSFARYSSTLTEIQLYNVNPTLAYKVSDSLLIGVGVDYYRSKVTLEKMVYFGPATPDGAFGLSGDGDGWGWNAGIIAKLGADFSLGLAYRSKVKVDYSGDATLSGIPAALQPLYGGSTFTTSGDAMIDYPAIAQLGIAAKVIPALMLEADVEWTGWSSYDKLGVDFASGLPDSSSTKDWNDTYTFRIGGKYQLASSFDLRAGYLYDKSPIPNEHFDTLLPDGKVRHGATLGFTYRVGTFSVDAAYMALFLTKRTIDTNNPDLANSTTHSNKPSYGGTETTGDYQGFSNIFALNLNYLF